MCKDPKEGGACWRCAKPAAAEDKYCRHCGSSLLRFPWYYQHWGVILLTLSALGPFSIVLVWRSPVFSRKAQWAYTAVIAGASWYFGMTSYHAWLAIKRIMYGAGANPLGSLGGF